MEMTQIFAFYSKCSPYPVHQCIISHGFGGTYNARTLIYELGLGLAQMQKCIEYQDHPLSLNPLQRNIEIEQLMLETNYERTL